MKKFAQLLAAACAAAVTLSAAPALAQNWPANPIKLIVPFPAGSATDSVARLYGKELQTKLGQTVIVENKPGAQGVIASEFVMRSPADGYTLLVGTNTQFAANVGLFKKLPYDPVKDFTPVAHIGATSLVLMVNSSSPAKTFPEFLKLIKERKGKMSAGYGSSSSQVSIASLESLAKVDALEVPYKGIPLAVNDVLAGTLDFTFVDLGNAMAHAKGGKMRALGVTAPKRSDLAPDWPALAETLPGMNVTAWFAVAGPAGMPQDVVKKLHATSNEILKNPELKDKLGKVGVDAAPMPLGEIKPFFAQEVKRWQKMLQDAGVEPQ